MLAELDRVIHDSRERLQRRERLVKRHAELTGRLETVLSELAELKRRLPAEAVEASGSGGPRGAASRGRAYPESRGSADLQGVRGHVAGLRLRKGQLLEDLRELSERIGEVEFAAAEYEDALGRKERLLRESDDPRAAELVEIAERLADVEAETRDHDAACQAGEDALRALHAVRDSLNHAHASATWGLLGSGASYFGKYEHLESAERAAVAAQRALTALRERLAGLSVAVAPRVSSPSALWSVNVFFDDVIPKIVQRDSIADAYDQMEELIQWVTSLVDRLRPYAIELADTGDALRARRRELLERGG
jgi:DNA repair exonuclease SbcCD ATPase subunit